jgi:undecaprenyl-diphosphatase
MDFSQLDYQLFQAINQFAETAAFLNPLICFLAEEAQYVFILGTIVYWFSRTKQNRRMIAEAFVSGCIALGFSGALGSLFYRDRPFVAHAVNQLISHPINASFPSDHATGAFVIASTIWIVHRRIGWIWIVLAAGIALSRVWVGVHYPSDVLAGALIGMASSAVVHAVFTHFLPAQRLLDGGIGLYEKVEFKVWRKRSVS